MASAQQNQPGSFRSTAAFTGKAGAARTSSTQSSTQAQSSARLEQGLPAPLRSTAAGIAAWVLAIAIGLFGIGGAKLHAKYTAAEQTLTLGTEADTAYGDDQTVTAQLQYRISAAQNVITSAESTLGADDARVTAAQEALQNLQTALDENAGASSLYDADAVLESAVDVVYGALQDASSTPLNMGSVQTQYSAFNSAGTVLKYGLTYNDAADAYNKEASGFPAGLVSALWGCGEVERFA